MRHVLRLSLLIIALGIAATGAAREPPNAAFLVAKPGLLDPNFRHTVVLVTHVPDGGTLGVIVNRPTSLRLSQLLGDRRLTRHYHDRLYFGGPVMLQTIVAAFTPGSVRPASAMHVLDNLYLTMSGRAIRTLLGGRERRLRLYLGFSGWAPGQLQHEVDRGSWYVMPADAGSVFRRNTSGLWRELVARADAQRVHFILSPRGYFSAPSRRQQETAPAVRGCIPGTSGVTARAVLTGGGQAAEGVGCITATFGTVCRIRPVTERLPGFSAVPRPGTPPAVACPHYSS